MQTIPTMKQQILDALDTLSPEDQERVFAFIQRLSHHPQGIPGKDLAAFFQQFEVPADEAQQMRAIMDEIAHEDN